ncbi:hypothetical protein PXK58_09015 [Phaeobacter gallaeciensis]|uniref:hypothetical protein n=1 Tax=Phaeobacter gallaeciensis TaxID=60890 RepID=UPI0023803310|nr:hypothetical protein [Phaeobacter gallaeciensis]MDE4274734.1 hypothetical protein [Phaeobacter gallaeciensis]MDE4299692.1 hypothetical protein [Phaeobacter gallaeciensis]MDE5184857.1 hypothetical protein [Phaeobacter gallaeciensis]
MQETHESEVSIWCDQGELEGCPVEFTYTATYEPADPSTGYTRPTWDVSGKIASIKIGGLKLNRDQMLAMTDQSQLDSREAFLAKEIEAAFECGDLPSYQHAAE